MNGATHDTFKGLLMLKGFRVQVIVRIAIIAATLTLPLHGLSQEDRLLPATLLGVGFLALVQVILLIRYVESTTRQLTLFFDSIHNGDFSQTFKAPVASGAHEELSKRLSEVMEAFRRTRSTTEEHLHYVNRVVQHIGIGLVSFDQNGDVELINNGAKRLLKLPGLKNIRTLNTLSDSLARTMSGMRSGERALVHTTIQGQSLQLALHAMAFRMKDKSYTLVSLQDIQGELDRERMAKELDIARDLQQRLLPKDGLVLKGFEVAGACVPAEQVGGDYYDFVRLPNGKLGIFIADVSGKGVPAAIYMTLTKGIAQACANQFESPKDVLSNINELIYGNVELGSFVTMAYMVLAQGDGPTAVARAGHTPALHYRHSENTASVIESQGMALGFKSGGIFSETLTEQQICLHPGDIALLYTDGVTESRNKQGEEFGIDRLRQSIVNHADRSAHGLVEAVSHDVREFSDVNMRHDDMTLVAVKKTSGT